MIIRYLELAKGWHAVLKPNSRASEHKSIKDYKKFIFSWISFIFITKYFNTGTERKLIDGLKIEIPASLKKRFFEYNHEKIEQLNSLRVANVTRPEKKYQQADKLTDSINKENYNEIIDALIDVLYVVRCNLFHGNKSWSEEQDNAVMAVSAPLLNLLLEELLKEFKDLK